MRVKAREVAMQPVEHMKDESEGKRGGHAASRACEG